MPFSEHEKARIARLVEKFGNQRIPPSVREQIRLQHQVKGDTVTLFETRPPWRGTGAWSSTPIARFRHEASTGRWSLYWHDGQSRWRPYDRCEEAADLAELLAEVDEDPARVFWG